MDTAEIGVVIGALALIVFTLWFFFGGHDEDVVVVNAEGRPLYECPMHPWITSANPADNCSICGMKLVRRGDAVAHSGPHSHQM